MRACGIGEQTLVGSGRNPRQPSFGLLDPLLSDVDPELA